jgi:hypothetical protein
MHVMSEAHATFGRVTVNCPLSRLGIKTAGLPMTQRRV